MPNIELKPHVFRNASVMDNTLNVTEDKIGRDPTETGSMTPKGLEPCGYTPSHELKKMRVVTNQLVEVGTIWWTVRLYRKLSRINNRCWVKMMRRSWKISLLVYQIVVTSLACLLILFVFLGLRDLFVPPALFIGLCAANCVSLLCLQGLFIAHLCRAVRHREHSRTLDIAYIVIMFCVSFLTMYLTILSLLVGSNLAWLLLFSLFGIGLFENLNIIGWIVVVPLLGVMLGVEGVVRTVICRLRCPQKTPLVREYSYQLYKFNVVKFSENKCMICLCEYTQLEAICALICHDSHIFHEDCIREWLKKQNTCPICRHAVQFRQ